MTALKLYLGTATGLNLFRTWDFYNRIRTSVHYWHIFVVYLHSIHLNQEQNSARGTNQEALKPTTLMKKRQYVCLSKYYFIKFNNVSYDCLMMFDGLAFDLDLLICSQLGAWLYCNLYNMDIRSYISCSYFFVCYQNGEYVCVWVQEST